jgi:hypothetical protein
MGISTEQWQLQSSPSQPVPKVSKDRLDKGGSGRGGLWGHLPWVASYGHLGAKYQQSKLGSMLGEALAASFLLHDTVRGGLGPRVRGLSLHDSSTTRSSECP